MNATTQELPAVSCPSCAARLAADQRYCLECGERSAAPAGRVLPARAPAPSPAPLSHEPWTTSATGAIAAVGCLLLAVGVGVLIGRSTGGGSPRTVAATPLAPQVITVATSGGAATAAAAPFADDWPAGRNGYTVELSKLPSASAVPAAKTDAATKGARGVGALATDNYQGLGAGSFVVYSGVYPQKAQAVKALGRLKAKFPAAKVIAVTPTASGSGGAAAASAAQPAAATAAPALQQLQNATGQDYVKKSKALPNKIVTGGAPPKIDKTKPAGGGTGFSSIG